MLTQHSSQEKRQISVVHDREGFYTLFGDKTLRDHENPFSGAH
jgi:hypothetical protein